MSQEPRAFRLRDFAPKEEAAYRPYFFQQPLKYFKWASVKKPAIFWSVAVGCIGPALFVVAPPIRKLFGDSDPSMVPHTYPIPSGPRKQLSGYDDE